MRKLGGPFQGQVIVLVFGIHAIGIHSPLLDDDRTRRSSDIADNAAIADIVPGSGTTVVTVNEPGVMPGESSSALKA